MQPLVPGNPLIYLHSVDSTNLHAARLLTAGEVVEGTVILAGYQSHGKGQGKNSWVGEPNSNLLFSLILYPRMLAPVKQFYLSMAVCNSMAEFLKKEMNGVTVKWPNDILVNGLKISGILIENTLLGNTMTSSIAGIGLNVNQTVFPDSIEPATSMAIETGKTYSLETALSELLALLGKWIDRLYSLNLELIRTSYLNQLWMFNTWHEMTDAEGRFSGRIADVLPTGELLVVKRNGSQQTYAFRELTFSR